MSDWTKYAGMPFLKQDRPSKVKEIYRALKRDHPDMPAAMKARIAARQGKKGKQHQGPPYKGPLTKKAVADMIPGGKADDKPLSDFPKKQVAMGQKIEMEHTDDPAKAREISRDHLEEFPDYYTRLKKMEDEAKMDKTAALDRALGVLYREYGPPKEKIASVNYFFYGINKEERDVEALGQQFCKLAAMSDVDPWAQALSIVRQLPRLEKLASCDDPAIRDLARFYLNWSDEMIKKAGILDVGIKGWRAAKAGAGALKSKLPQSSASRMSQAVKADAGIAASKAAPAAAKPQGVGEAMRASLKESKGLQQAGGGSIRRGEKLVAQDPGLMRATQGPLHPGTPPAPVGGGGAQFSPGRAQQAGKGLTGESMITPHAPPAAGTPSQLAPTQMSAPRAAQGAAVTRPPASGSAATVVPGETAVAGQEAARTGLTRGQLLAGGGILGGLGLAGGAALSGGGQPQYAGGY